jgi:hypothetical protein
LSKPKNRKLIRTLLKDFDRNKKDGTFPISEKYQKERLDMTKEDCIALLKGLAEADPDRFITRNWFRVNSGITENTWNRYWGTFREFKVAAGVTVSRHVRRMEMEIAKHSSVDHYRVMNGEIHEYVGKYTRTSNKRWQTILVAADFHDKGCDPFALRVFLDVAKRVQPEIVVLAGDVLDLPEFGVFTVDPRDWDPVGRIDFVQQRILAPIRSLCPNADIRYHLYNHEYRLIRHLADKTPAMRAVLSDFLGMSLSDLFGLDEFQISVVSKADLAAFTKAQIKNELRKNYETYFDCFLVHHFTRDLLRRGMPGLSGHNHKHLAWSFESPTWGSYEVHQIGAMCFRDATYCEAERWNNGFALVHVDTQMKRSTTEYIQVGETVAVAGGKYYFRQDDERVPLGMV